MSQLDGIDIASLTLVKYPDPRLTEPCGPVEAFDDRLKAFVERMFQIMEASGGVGLAAPQAGVNLRLFVANVTHEPDGQRVYANPELVNPQGTVDDEEGCLSLPGVVCRVRRAQTITIRAQDVKGQPFEETADDLLARVFQHEYDHLDGTLLVHRMSPAARISNRRALKDLEASAAE